MALDRSLEWDGERLFTDIEEGPAAELADEVEPLFDLDWGE